MLKYYVKAQRPAGASAHGQGRRGVVRVHHRRGFGHRRSGRRVPGAGAIRTVLSAVLALSRPISLTRSKADTGIRLGGVGLCPPFCRAATSATPPDTAV